MKSAKEFSDKFRRLKPEYSHLDDISVIRLVQNKKPNLLKNVNSDDIIESDRQMKRRELTEQRKKSFSTLSGYDRFMSATGQGMLDMYMGIKQLVGGDTKDYQESKKAYMEASEGDFLAGAGEITGAIAATAPIPGVALAKLGTKAALAAGAGVGAGFGATEHVDEGESRLKNTAYGSLFGAGTAGAGMLVKKIGTKAFNALKGKMKNASLQELNDLAKANNMKLSKGDLTGKSGTRKAEVAAESKVGGLSGFREEQAGKANKVMKKLVKDMEPKAGKNVGKQLLESTERARDAAKKQATKNYNKVEELSGGAKVEATNTIKKLGNVQKEFKGDVPADQTTVDWFDTMAENMSSGKKSYTSLRKTRESLGKEAKKHAVSDPNRARLVMELRNEVEKDMDDAIMGQVESMTKRKGRATVKAMEQTRSGVDAGKVKTEMLGEAEKQIQKGKDLKSAYETAKKQYREDVVPYKTSTSLKAILKGEEPDQIYKKMIQEGHNDKAKIFYKALDKDGKETVAYGIVKTALDKAKTTTPQGTNYSPVKFSTYLEDMGEHSKLFMSTENKAKTDGIEKLMKAAARAGQYAENPPTGNRAEIAKELRNAKLTLGLIPLLTQFEKFFWTGKGKSFLLASSKLDVGSPKWLESLRKIEKEIPLIGGKQAYSPLNLPKTGAVTGAQLGE